MKERNAAKNSVILKKGKEGVGLGRRGKKWAGLVRLIAPELCRKNKLSCRRRAELGWAERGMGIAGGGLRVDQYQDWKIPQFQIRRLGT